MYAKRLGSIYYFFFILGSFQSEIFKWLLTDLALDMIFIIGEVEHKLSTTREMNVNLQALLERALTSQKQSSSNTSHLVRNIQADLTRVRIIYGISFI